MKTDGTGVYLYYTFQINSLHMQHTGQGYPAVSVFSFQLQRSDLRGQLRAEWRNS